MWRHRITEPAENTTRYEIITDGVLSVGQVVELLVSSSDFRLHLTELLRETPFVAYRWETPPVTQSTLNRPFEFVLVRHDRLRRPADRSPFAERFDDSDVVTFANLSGDATLVVPCPRSDSCDYAHLAGFLQTAPAAQIDQLWPATGLALQERVGNRPVWLSTAGMGVAWLHIRLDDRPKYYAYEPYRTWTA